MDRFCAVIHHCGFTDLGYTGSPFTWSRNHLVDGRTYILLDRALATIAWKSLFQNTVVQHMPTFVSDHSVLIVNLPSIRHRQPKLQPPFRFEAMWLKDPHCVEVVQKALMEGLYKLEAWLEQELQALDHQPQQNFERIQEVLKALDCWLDIENTMWHQWAKQMWITDGDRNTSFFHQKASNRKQKNFIEGLTDEHGRWQIDDHLMEQITLGYFSDIFHSNGPTDTLAVVIAIKPVVIDSMNRFLCQPFQADEVH
nr:uncharacterized protein LOC112029810 [Quercus suber]